jgi:predicted DNA-binding protein (UPF0251 family)
MARPQKSRKVLTPPLMQGFKPFGMPMCKAEPILMSFEEYECIRLINYDLLSQDAAAELMSVSRPTFTRIYNKALKNIAKAFIEGKAIVIEGGNYQFESEWFRCARCYKLIEGLENHTKCKNCPAYGNAELLSLNP